ncbi:MAG: hypothetical protein HZB65_00715 [Candidatus Aenigmarchaeota archaeon]|nr:hypothetical protein [Candidatus Aenigmarchaeota archaeon]
MLEIAIIIAFIGALTAGILDLRSSEFPDDIPYLMIALGIFIWFIYALTFADFQPLFFSLALGALFSIIGYASYRFGVWGDGDAAILAAVVFVLPSILFIADFIINLLIVSIIYLVIYSLAIGLGKKQIRQSFIEDVIRRKSLFIAYIIFSSILIIASYMIIPELFINLSLLLLLGISMICFILYGKNIEKKLFKKKIPINELKEGDVLASSRQLRGLTNEEIREIKKHHNNKFIEIKEGVRFTIVFAIAIAITAFFGNLLFVLLGA